MFAAATRERLRCTALCAVLIGASVSSVCGCRRTANRDELFGDAGFNDAGFNDASHDGGRTLVWQLVELPGWTEDVRTVAARSDNDVWLAGEAGLLAHYDGESFTRIDAQTTQTINQIHLVEGGAWLAVDADASRYLEADGATYHVHEIAMEGESAFDVMSVVTTSAGQEAWLLPENFAAPGAWQLHHSVFRVTDSAIQEELLPREDWATMRSLTFGDSLVAFADRFVAERREAPEVAEGTWSRWRIPSIDDTLQVAFAQVDRAGRRWLLLSSYSTQILYVQAGSVDDWRRVDLRFEVEAIWERAGGMELLSDDGSIYRTTDETPEQTQPAFDDGTCCPYFFSPDAVYATENTLIVVNYEGLWLRSLD